MSDRAGLRCNSPSPLLFLSPSLSVYLTLSTKTATKTRRTARAKTSEHPNRCLCQRSLQSCPTVQHLGALLCPTKSSRAGLGAVIFLVGNLSCTAVPPAEQNGKASRPPSPAEWVSSTVCSRTQKLCKKRIGNAGETDRRQPGSGRRRKRDQAAYGQPVRLVGVDSGRPP